jgi:hypothetical protein
MNTYHKHAKEWAVRSGAIMEDIITNFEFKRARLIRVCPTCAHIQDKPFDLHIVGQEPGALRDRVAAAEAVLVGVENTKGASPALARP